MDVVTDLTSYAVSVITTVQDLIRCRATAPNTQFHYTDDEDIWEVYQRLQHMDDRLEQKIISRIGEIVWASNPVESRENIREVFRSMCTNLMQWLQQHAPGHFAQLRNKYQLECGSVKFIPHHWRYVISTELYGDQAQRLILANMLHYMPIQVLLCLGARNKSPYHQRLYQTWNLNATLHTLSTSDLEAYEKWWADTQNNMPNRARAEALLQDDALLLQELQQSGNALPFETLFPAELSEVYKSRKGRLRNQHKVQLATTPGQNTGESLDVVLQQIITEQEGWVARFDPKPAGEAADASFPATLRAYLEKLFWMYNQPPGQATNQAGGASVSGKPRRLGPTAWAQKLQLVGLAFSGGGIRSATFNLGVLQHLAEKGFLPFVDYSSTVSGGGYIGSWLVSWIREAGSVQKVAERLNAKKSADPMAEEVRPVRWLRMYSNYLTPQASIMSADAWTMGITWLRNTVVNQLILVLLTCTVLAGIITLFYAWEQLSLLVSFSRGNGTRSYVLVWSLITLLPICLFTGMGMRTYNKDFPPQSWVNRIGRNPFLSTIITAWAFLSALFIAAWMFPDSDSDVNRFGALLSLLLPTAIVGLVGLLAMAFMGRYHTHWGGPSDSRTRPGRKSGYAAVLLSSLVGAALGWLLLAAVWLLFGSSEWLKSVLSPGTDFPHKVFFTLGPPLIMEVFSLVVVARMAIMGNLFPDGRREWWGKMGAIKHRFSLFWILVCYPALFFLDQFRNLHLDHFKALLPLVGGWAGIVGFAVKLAYDAGPQPESKKGFGVKEVFIRFAPYLFIAGFLLLCAVVLQNALVPLWDRVMVPFTLHKWVHFFLLTLVLAIITILLGWRVGVNEFSLHYFYRNRLVRAYLGAVRRRTDRSRTANDFTGFDECDDQPLKAFRTCMDYYGPYPLINTTLNATVITELDRQDRKGEAFIFSPLYCGFDVSPTRSASFSRTPVFDYGYRPTDSYAYHDGPSLGTAMAVSGAAVNPNMGYHSSAATSFLLTVFNVRLGWWMGNPRGHRWQRADPNSGLAYIVKDLIGKSDIRSDYVCLSDGGHFDNMGLYELIRRRCKWIILSDAEEDANLQFEGLANAIRRCYIDFGAVISIDVTPIKEHKAHVVFGDIRYAGELEPWGKLIYIKPVLTGDEPSDVVQYKEVFAQFPHQSTSDQFFNESQFESYRNLGWHSLSCNKARKQVG